ncbi:imm11 family protein [Aestuariivirga sp.]|uniref:imm11 family protein n=1 Tax=Aestuariivirga sp. TaxID=2650926 RepID=UPI0039E5E879
MPYFVGTRDPDEVSYGYTFLDGDYSKVTTLDPDMAKRPPPDSGLFFSYNRASGFAIDSTYLSKRLQKNGPRRAVPDVTMAKLLLVSEAFKEVIERFDPGLHQFFPVDVLWEDGQLAARQYFFNVCTRLDTVDRTATTARFEHIWRTWEAGAKLVFNLAAIGPHHVWCDKFLSANPFVSDALGQALIERNFSGLGLPHFEAV